MSDALSFKKFHAFVSLEAEPTDDQITEIFGIFKNNTKLDDLKKKRAELTDKQKLDAKKKDALLANRAKELKDNGGFDPKERGTLTMRSKAATGRSAERDWVQQLANEGTDGAQYSGYGVLLVKYGFKRQKAAGTYRNEDDTSCGTIRVSKEGHWTHSSSEGDFEGTTAQTLENHLNKICKEAVTLDAETIIREGVRDLLDGSLDAEEIIAVLFQSLDDEQKEELKTLAFSEAVAIAEELLETMAPPKGVQARVAVAMSGGQKKSLTTAYQNWFGKFGEKDMNWKDCVAKFCDTALPEGFDEAQAKAYLQQVHQGE